jgi:hypothetical protein
MTHQRAWIGIDLDGTLAQYEHWTDGSIGEPIMPMIDLVKTLLSENLYKVKIFTARVSPASRPAAEAIEQRSRIEDWCVQHLGQVLDITHEKDSSMVLMYDDRCVQVEKNTGRLLSPGVNLGS